MEYFETLLYLLPGCSQGANVGLVLHHGVVFLHHVHALVVIDGTWLHLRWYWANMVREIRKHLMNFSKSNSFHPMLGLDDILLCNTSGLLLKTHNKYLFAIDLLIVYILVNNGGLT